MITGVPMQTSVAWLRPANGRLLIEDCVMVSPSDGVILQQEESDAAGATAKLSHNTIVAGLPAGLMYHVKQPHASPKKPPSAIEASDNIFYSQHFFNFGWIPASAEVIDTRAAQANLRQWLTWNEHRNLYKVEANFLVMHQDPAPSQFPTDVVSLQEWHALWQATDTGAQEGIPKFQLERLTFRDISRPEELRAEDFRLMPGSPGHAAGDGEQDLGARTEFVGPGSAYDSWKKTPAYRAWLSNKP
jgi:hypothetical protein